MRKVRLTEETRKNILNDLLKRSPNHYGDYAAVVQEIVEAVANRGDEAVFAYTEQFDHVTLTGDTVQVTEEEVEAAYREIQPELLTVIRKALKNIRDYHEKQRRVYAGDR